MKRIGSFLSQRSGVIGLLVTATSLGVNAYLGESADKLKIQIFGLIGIGVWIYWVSSSLYRLTNNQETRLEHPPKNILTLLRCNGAELHQEIEPGNSWDSKDNPEWKNRHIAQLSVNGNRLVLQRLKTDDRYLLNVRKYYFGAAVGHKRYIPDKHAILTTWGNDRYLGFSLIARAQKAPHTEALPVVRTSGG